MTDAALEPSVSPQPRTETEAERRSREAYFTASQGQLIWARFKKQRAAMVAGVVLIMLVLMGFFAPFLSPYDPTIAGRNADYMNGAPQIPMFCDHNGCSLRPFVHTEKNTYTMSGAVIVIITLAPQELARQCVQMCAGCARRKTDLRQCDMTL